MPHTLRSATVHFYTDIISSCALSQLLTHEHIVDDNVCIVTLYYWSLHFNIVVSWHFLRASHCQEDDTFTPMPSTYKSSVLREFFTAALVRSIFGHLLLPCDTRLQWKPLTVNATLPFGQIYLLVDSGQNRCPISENRKDDKI